MGLQEKSALISLTEPGHAGWGTLNTGPDMVRKYDL